MTKDDLQDIALGVALVALGYALWQHFKDRKTASSAPAAFAATDPTKPDHGFGYDPYNPGELLTIDQILKGTVADWFSGTKAAEEIPTVDGLVDSVTKEAYGVEERPGDFMRTGYW